MCVNSYERHRHETSEGWCTELVLNLGWNLCLTLNYLFHVNQQPRPMKCTSCEASGSQECAWCKGTGFFILGDSMLCEVPSRNTRCVICSGQVRPLPSAREYREFDS